MGTPEQNRRYYEKNKEAQFARNRATRKRNVDFVAEIKERTPCTDCGVQYPSYVMEFDHVRGTKELDVSVMCSNLYSIEKIQEEIAKCELVCANCHRERTFSRKQPVEAR